MSLPASGTSLTFGNTVAIPVRFRPIAEQVYSGYIVFTSNSVTSPDTVVLSGIGYFFDDAPDTPLPLAFELKPLYPNPFNGAVNISFSLPKASDVSLNVYDVLGRQVSTMINGTMNAGLHTAQWNCAECAAGIYLFKLEAAGQTFVQKAAYVK
ncbi:MAG: T9SS type A sorting domain-containing protein [bacterium]|nr:T9SS type A sorting domain-containing protein [bacterium]